MAAETQPLPDLGCACATARRLARVLTQVYDGHLKASGLEVPQFGMLSVLYARPGCSQVALGRALALDKTTLSRNLKVLQQKGWVEPVSSSDSRQRGFMLSAAGAERLRSARPHWRRAQKQLQTALKGEEWDAMWTTFRTVTEVARSL